MNLKITADGKYKINTDHSMSKSVVYVKGNAGGAVLKLQTFGQDIVEGVITVDTQTEVRHGKDVELILSVTGGVGSDIDIRCVGIH